MARSYRKNPGINDFSNKGERVLRRRARRQANKAILADMIKDACIDDAADGAVFVTAQEADGSYWGCGWFGHLTHLDGTYTDKLRRK